jgi:hypothetical protein
MAFTPKMTGIIVLDLTIPPYVNENIGPGVTEIFFSGAYNGGLQLRFSMYDTNLERWDAFYKNVWYPKKLKEEIKVHFKIAYAKGVYPETSTRKIQLLLTKANVRARGGFGGIIIDFEAITTADYQLAYAGASGKAYKGKISKAIEKVIAENTSIPYKVTPTLDNDENYWYMMRQRPTRFIRQLMEMGTMFTKSKTQMVYGVKEYAPVEGIPPLINICPQGEFKPKPLGIYKNADIFEIYAIGNEDFIAMINKLASSGISTTTGEYIDIKSDPKELYCIVKDINTSSKITAGYPTPHGPIKQNDAVGFLKGTSASRTPPELYNDGSTGFMYRDYIRNRATNLYLNGAYNLIHARFDFPGAGLIDNTIGLGTDTVYIEYVRPANAAGVVPVDLVLDQSDGPDQFHNWTGNWTLMGFEHRWNIDTKEWRTIFDVCRFTTDTASVRFSAKE